MKVGLFPADTTQQLVLIMIDGQRRSLAVIASSAPDQAAARYLDSVDDHLDVTSEGVAPTSIGS